MELNDVLAYDMFGNYFIRYAMNERIKELLSQAGVYYEVMPKDTVYEKFAELIIQECASLFPLTFTDEQYQRRIDKTIRKHFGVEE